MSCYLHGRVGSTKLFASCSLPIQLSVVRRNVTAANLLSASILTWAFTDYFD